MGYDAAEGCAAACRRLENAKYKQQVAAFSEDHLRHTRELSAVAHELQLDFPDGPDAEHLLPKGKLTLAEIFGDKAILKALKSNIEDTRTAYERALAHRNLHPLARPAIQRGVADQRRHHAWIESELKAKSESDTYASE
ncbi:MAG: rubrerythrin family protein [Proteobacteria bacterium]|nr:rubrerythrin family protein [Pseudomonadota bacterium]